MSSSKRFERFSLDLNYYERISENKFKELLSEKSKLYAFNKFTLMKEKHSKMRKLDYKVLEMQSYLVSERTNLREKRMLIRWRTFMEKFGENYRGGREYVLCPICKTHRDGEEESFTECKEVLVEADTEGTFDNIFEENISRETINKITRIMKIRERRKDDGKDNATNDCSEDG